ncbi:protein of unknown function [Rhodovastum atsumiense]|nr:protein of unknown function [Rhodovastum atsumiense]
MAPAPAIAWPAGMPPSGPQSRSINSVIFQDLLILLKIIYNNINKHLISHWFLLRPVCAIRYITAS